MCFYLQRCESRVYGGTSLIHIKLLCVVGFVEEFWVLREGLFLVGVREL